MDIPCTYKKGIFQVEKGVGPQKDPALFLGFRREITLYLSKNLLLNSISFKRMAQ
jgi:hypothetical protein